MTAPCLRPQWPAPREVWPMVIDGAVLSIASEQDGPGEPHTLTHTVTLADGRERTVDWTPYTAMTREDGLRWLRLGMPRRSAGSYRALNSKTLEAMERERDAA